VNDPDVVHIVAIIEAEVDKRYAPIFAELAAQKVLLQDIEQRLNRLDQMLLPE